MRVKDKDFEIFIERNSILQRVKELARAIEIDYKEKNPLFICILNGSFIFASDLIREISLTSEISFVKLSSYKGLESSGIVKRSSEIENIEGREIIIIEDIVDTGKTLAYFLEEITALNPQSIAIASLLFKPEALKNPLKLDYVGFEIPNKFVIGYGLDYDGRGRNLKDIYQLKEN
ncbi:hypoxanthine phosphoribosyltransferase [soil metagenome]|jgi:hypoxanthine phosphoribosyltransferase